MPTPPLQLEREGASVFYWDAWRTKWLQLTPEEWVRQHVLFALMEKGFPPSCLSVEKSAGLKRKKRYDILAIGPDGSPRILVECKEPGEKLQIPVAFQALGYQKSLFSPYLWLTNGHTHIFLSQNPATGEIRQLPELPSYPDIL